MGMRMPKPSRSRKSVTNTTLNTPLGGPPVGGADVTLSFCGAATMRDVVAEVAFVVHSPRMRNATLLSFGLASLTVAVFGVMVANATGCPGGDGGTEGEGEDGGPGIVDGGAEGEGEGEGEG